MIKSLILSALVAAATAAVTTLILVSSTRLAHPTTVSATTQVPEAAAAPKSIGASTLMPLTQGEYIELKMNLECLAMGGSCSAYVSESGASTYVLLKIDRGAPKSDEDLAMQALMEFYRSFDRMPWPKQVILNQNIGPSKYRVARVSLTRSGDATPYDQVYKRIAWISQTKSFLPGVPANAHERIPLSEPWKN